MPRTKNAWDWGSAALAARWGGPLLLALGACDKGTPPPQSAGPPVHVQLTIPADGDIDVPLNQSVRVQFDRFLQPLAAVRQSACLYSVSSSLAKAANVCDVFLEPTYDPVDRVAVFRPMVPLLPHVRYTMRIIAPVGDSSNGIRAFDGTPLDGDYVFSFMTGDADTPSHEPNRTVSYTGRACGSADPPLPNSPKATFATCSLCHQSGSPLTFDGISGAFLDLTDDGVRALVSPTVRIAQETLRDPVVLHPSEDGSGALGVNMAYLDSHFSGNSFLLYKMILALENVRPIAPPSNDCDGDALDASHSEPDDAMLDDSAIRDASDENEAGAFDPNSGPRTGMGSGGPDSGSDDGAPLDASLAESGVGSCSPSSASTLIDPFIPANLWHAPAPGEYARLHIAIFGNPMSPPGIMPTTYEQAEAMSEWIAGGFGGLDDCR